MVITLEIDGWQPMVLSAKILSDAQGMANLLAKNSKAGQMAALGIPIALLPSLFNYQNLWNNGRILRALGTGIVYGVTIPLAVWSGFAMFYALRIFLSIRTGRELQVSRYVNLAINLFGMTGGISLSLLITKRWFGSQTDGFVFLAAALFGSIVIAVISVYDAYRRAREESLRLQAAVAEARYHSLEQQMRPHFLFNALNSLAELIESGREDAAETTYKLAELYRRILANSGLKTATLESELEIVSAYLELEQLRFGKRLEFSIHTAENRQEIHLPSLMLQTLVENAVKHGIAPAVEGGRIEITVNRNNEGFSLQVVNTGEPLRQTNVAGTGLANTRARLELLYGSSHKLELRREADRTVAGFCFSGEKIV